MIVYTPFHLDDNKVVPVHYSIKWTNMINVKFFKFTYLIKEFTMNITSYQHKNKNKTTNSNH